MIDPKRIRADKDYITKNLARRGVKFNLDKLNYKLLNLNQVGGNIVLNNKSIEMKDLTFAANTSLKSEQNVNKQY